MLKIRLLKLETELFEVFLIASWSKVKDNAKSMPQTRLCVNAWWCVVPTIAIDIFYTYSNFDVLIQHSMTSSVGSYIFG